MAKVVVPDLGTEVKEATISYWYFEEGAQVQEGDNLVEISTDKATFNIQAPAGGTIAQIMVEEGTSVQSNDVLAIITEAEVAGEEDNNG